MHLVHRVKVRVNILLFVLYYLRKGFQKHILKEYPL
jgi:hypothetical protein